MKQETFEFLLYYIGLIAFIVLCLSLVEIVKKEPINDEDKTMGGTM